MLKRKLTAGAMLNSHQQKHRVISLLLDDIINCMLPGEKLPGIRELQRLSGCGRPVVEAELRRCAAEGKIAVRPRQGFFRSAVCKNPRKIILLHDSVYSPGGRGFVSVLFDILREVVEKDGYDFSIVNFSGENIDFIQRASGIFDTENVILYGCKSAEIAEAVHREFRFCMELLPRHGATGGAEIRDSPEMTLIQFRYLLRLNYEKIGYFHHVEQTSFRTLIEYRRLFDYYRLMAEHGLKVNPEWVLFAPWEWENFECAMEKFFSSGDVPEAVIVPGSALVYFYRYCRKNGIEIGKQIGVMGCDDIYPELRPKITTTTNDPEIIAADAWLVMKELLRGNILQRTTTLHVRPGDSICYRPAPHFCGHL